MRKMILLTVLWCVAAHSWAQDTIYPSRIEVITPIRKTSFTNNGQCPERRQGGNARMVNGYSVFDGSMDGNRQVDPQIAVGGGYVLHGTNSGLVIYNKEGQYLKGVSQKCFNDGIDPKMCFDIHNKVFIFDLWWYYDPPKIKPVNISVSETSDPTGAWNTYPVPATEAKDGGAIGYSRKWIGYSFPGGSEQTFVLRAYDAKGGKPASVYHFQGSLGHPVFVQDPIDDLYFFAIEGKEFVIRKVSEGPNGDPFCQVVARKPHGQKYMGYPPPSPQKGTAQKVSSGDRNPKNLVLQSGSIWFSQAVNVEGRSAVQWHELRVSDGSPIQTGLISSDTSSYIQTTIAVNKKKDVLIGFQEAGSNSFISPRFAYRKAKDNYGTIRRIIRVGEGRGAADGVAWGDYSGSIVDGDNLLDLWTIQSVASEKGRGETVIVRMPARKTLKGKQKNKELSGKAVGMHVPSDRKIAGVIPKGR